MILKILYLDAISVHPEAEMLAKRLGLNVTFLADNNNTLKESVRYELGNFDIIIASDSYSRKLLSFHKESKEQCKDTGRPLVLLLTYKIEDEIRYNNHNDSYFLGYQMNLCYSFGGLLSTSLEKREEVFQILDDKSESMDGSLKYIHRKSTCMKAILEGAVELYNQALEKERKPFVTGFKTMNQYQIEFTKSEKEFEEEKEKEIAPFNDYNQLICSLNYYLEYRKKGLVPASVEGIEIIDKKSMIKVTNIIQGIPYCSMTMKKSNNNSAWLKRFMIQTRTKKGRLGDEVEVGIYTKMYEGKDGVPKRLNEDQQGAFTSICKKVNKVILPLNVEAFNRKRKMEEEQKERPKQKSYRRNRK